MKIIYEAFDGKQFETEDECYSYEAFYEHPYLHSIVFYDKNDNKYLIGNDIFVDSIYQEAEKIRIHNENEIKDLLWLADQCGWCEFEDITEPGFWIRKELNFLGDAEWEKINE